LDKARISALFLLGVFALMVVGSLSVPSSVNAVPLAYAPIEPTKNYQIAAGDYEFTATSFTDTYATFTDGAYATDGDWGTAVYETTAVTADYLPVAYWSGFDSGTTGTGTITQVDVVIRLSVSGTLKDEWGWILVNSGDTTLRAEATGDQTLTNLTYSDVAEPADASWSWADVQSCQIDLDYDKIAGADNFDIYIYEVCLVITVTAGGTDYTAYPDGDITLTGSPDLIADFIKTLTDGFALAGTTSLFAGFVKTLIEGFTLAGTTNIFVIIQKIITEGFSLTGDTSLAISYSVLLAAGFVLVGIVSLASNYSVRLSVGFSLGGTVALAVAYIKTISEGFSLAGTVSALKVLIVNLIEDITVGVSSNITKIAGTVLIGSMFYQLFFSVNMWGYLGPFALIGVGYILASKDKTLGLLCFIVQSLVIANYLTLVEATPDYWWHIFILLIGCIITISQSLGSR